MAVFGVRAPLFLEFAPLADEPWCARVGGDNGRRGMTARDAVELWWWDEHQAIQRRVGLSTTEPGAVRAARDRLKQLRAAFEGGEG